MDHFAGFDRLLRVCLHRARPLHLIGPADFADRVEHKLKAYTLNLLREHPVDFVITAAEFNGEGFDRVCEFRAQEAFCRREVPPERLSSGVLLDEDAFRIKSVVLDHGTPCLAFAFEEKLRVNVWSEGLKNATTCRSRPVTSALPSKSARFLASTTPANIGCSNPIATPPAFDGRRVEMTLQRSNHGRTG